MCKQTVQTKRGNIRCKKSQNAGANKFTHNRFDNQVYRADIKHHTQITNAKAEREDPNTIHEEYNRRTSAYPRAQRADENRGHKNQS